MLTPKASFVAVIVGLIFENFGTVIFNNSDAAGAGRAPTGQTITKSWSKAFVTASA
ncbi:MAG: hypothetical protein R8F89_02535 [Roseobacter sp.]|nr:hypothetical protein [Roseobacter sp.]